MGFPARTGLTLALANAWDDAAPTRDDVIECAMTHLLTGARMPFQGIIRDEGTIISHSGPDGTPSWGTCKFWARIPRPRLISTPGERRTR